MEEEIIFEESKLSTKKKFFIFVVVFALIIGVIIFFFRMNNFNIKKTIKLELGDKISTNIEDYITNKPMDTKKYKLNIDNVIFDKDYVLTTAGEYKYQVSLNDVIKEGTIIVSDSRAPIVETNDLTIGVDEEFKLDDFIFKCDDYSLPCEVTTDSKYDKSKEGTYDLKLKVSDHSGNSVDKQVKLTVKYGASLSDMKTNDMEPATLEPSFDDWDKSYVIKFSQAFDPEDYDNYRWTYYNEFLNDNYSNYLPSKASGKSVKDADVIAVYNKYHYIIGFAARATLSDGSTVYLTNGE